MRFKDWLAEQLSTAGIDKAMTSNPTAAAGQLNKAVQGASQMPLMDKLATMGTQNNPRAVQAKAIDLSQQYLKQNPLSSQTPGLTAPAIANGLLRNITPTGQRIPSIGGVSKTRKFAKKK